MVSGEILLLLECPRGYEPIPRCQCKPSEEGLLTLQRLSRWYRCRLFRSIRLCYLFTQPRVTRFPRVSVTFTGPMSIALNGSTWRRARLQTPDSASCHFQHRAKLDVRRENRCGNNIAFAARVVVGRHGKYIDLRHFISDSRRRRMDVL